MNSNDNAEIAITLERDSEVSLDIYNVDGRQVN